MLNRNMRHIFVLGLVAGVILTGPAAQADSFFPVSPGDLSPPHGFASSLPGPIIAGIYHSPAHEDLIPHAGTDATTDGAPGLGGVVPGGSLAMYSNAPAFGPRGFGLAEPDAFSAVGPFSLFSRPTRPVPAPSAFLLLGAGFLGILWLARKRGRVSA